jgi:anhydro-N-acetylmuramic acid kinase
MTGTSLDGMDVALVRIEGHGLSMQCQLLACHSAPIDDLAPTLRDLANGVTRSVGDINRISRVFGQRHVDTITQLLAGQAGDTTPDLISVHGQTIFHEPPHSWQLIDPTPIAHGLRCPVLFDLRQADVLAGGEGAPITPLADWVLLRSSEKRRAIINLGGFCNMSILPREDQPADEAIRHIRGFDVCVCNQLLDAIAQRVFSKPFDEAGTHALQGHLNKTQCDALLHILREDRAEGKSLGQWPHAHNWLGLALDSLKPDDLAATACAAIGGFIAETVKAHDVDEVIAAGGGALNEALVSHMQQAMRADIHTSDAMGIPITMREAMAMAVLGALCADGVPITLPQVTGCSDPAPVAGSWCGLEFAKNVRD